VRVLRIENELSSCSSSIYQEIDRITQLELSNCVNRTKSHKIRKLQKLSWIENHWQDSCSLSRCELRGQEDRSDR